MWFPFRPSCPWSGWHQRAFSTICTPPWATCGHTAFCFGKFSPWVSLSSTQIQKNTKLQTKVTTVEAMHSSCTGIHVWSKFLTVFLTQLLSVGLIWGQNLISHCEALKSAFPRFGFCKSIFIHLPYIFEATVKTKKTVFEAKETNTQSPLCDENRLCASASECDFQRTLWTLFVAYLCYKTLIYYAVNLFSVTVAFWGITKKIYLTVTRGFRYLFAAN